MANYLEHDWFPAPVPACVQLGEGAWVDTSYTFMHLDDKHPGSVVIGDHAGLYSGTSFELGPSATVRIGPYTSVISVIFSTNGTITIGSHGLLAYGVVIADTPWAVPSHRGSDGPGPTADTVMLGDDVWIGARCVLLGGTTVGDGCIVGAGSVVQGEFPPMSLIAGNPARVVRSLSPG